jgi:hypothetical protein
MSPPNLERPIADWERLAKGLETSMGLVRRGEENLPRWFDLDIDYQCLRTLSSTLRGAKWNVTVSVWQDKEVMRSRLAMWRIATARQWILAQPLLQCIYAICERVKC